jgi:hypothetical protein
MLAIRHSRGQHVNAGCNRRRGPIMKASIVKNMLHKLSFAVALETVVSQSSEGRTRWDGRTTGTSKLSSRADSRTQQYFVGIGLPLPLVNLSPAALHGDGPRRDASTKHTYEHAQARLSANGKY